MHILLDGKDQPYIQWTQAEGGYKRAWIQRREGPESDWAGTGRYLNVVRCGSPSGPPAGQATDFPIFNSQLSDEQILRAFVHTVCAITGCALPDEGGRNA